MRSIADWGHEDGLACTMTRVHIKGGRLVDPNTASTRPPTSISPKAGSRASARRPAASRPTDVIDATGLVVGAGAGGPLGAAARAGLRIQGDARVGDARGGRRRRHQRSPARPTPIRRSTSRGWSRCSRAALQPRTWRASIRSARSPRARGRAPDRDGGAARGRLHRRSRRPTRRSPTPQVLLRAHAVRGDLRLHRVAAPAGSASRRGGVAHDGEVATRLGLPAIPVFAETIALAHDPRADARHRRRVHLVPAVVAARVGRAGRARPSARGCRSPAT